MGQEYPGFAAVGRVVELDEEGTEAIDDDAGLAGL